MSQKRTQKLAFAALFGALTFAATWVSFPSPFGGNINLGDCILLVSAWLPLEPWSIFACAVGATFTDLAAGYAIYAPATFVIKALMVAVAILIKHGTQKLLPIWRALLSGVDVFDNDTLFAALTPLTEKLSIKTGTLMWCIRIAVSGLSATPGGATEIMEVIGKDESLKRIDLALAKLA